MTVNKNYVLRCVGNQYVAVPVGKEYKQIKRYIKLNDSAHFIWQSLADGKSEAETILGMVEKYQIAQDKAAGAYHKAVEKMIELDIL
ncbi:MAG: PqqD family protein, partial [Oscillospiraceae bacterium]|nr:PqqD family protein [Oscillospiraceae bacterium]